MACTAAGWIERNPRWHYRSCYDDAGRTCCRADVQQKRPGEWFVTTKKAGMVSTPWGSFLSESAARSLARGKLEECGCTGLGKIEPVQGLGCLCGTRKRRG